MTQPVFDQDAYRGRDDSAGLNADAGWHAALNTDWTQDPGVTFRVRFLIQETSGNKGNNIGFGLWFSHNGGAWTQVTTASSVIRLTDDGQGIADNATTSQVIGSGTYTTGDSEGYDDGTTDVGTGFVDFGGNDEAELEFCLTIVSADISENDTIALRVRDGGAEITNYTNEPAINVGAPPNPTVVQANFRVRDNDSETLNSATFSHGLNVNPTIDAEQRFRIRFEVEETAGDQFASAITLQYRRNAGTWTDVPDAPEDEGTRTAVNRVECWYSTQFGDGAATTDVLSGSAQPFKTGNGITDNATGEITLQSQHTEFEYPLVIHKFADGRAVNNDGDTFEFRIVQSDGTPFDTYTNTPTVTLNWPVGLVGGVFAENAGYIGPYIDTNGNLYVLVEDTEVSALCLMLKSVDGGDTWEPMDIAGAPTVTDFEGVSIRQDGDVLHLLHHGGGDVFYHTFNTSDNASPDTWGITDETVVAGIAPTDQWCSMEVLSDGRIRAFWITDSDAVGYGTRNGSWTIHGTFDTNAFQVWTALSQTVADTVHIFSNDNSVGELYWRELTSGTNTPSAAVTLATDVGTGTTDQQPIAGAFAFDDAGVDSARVVYKDSAHILQFGGVDDGVAITAVAVSDVAVEEDVEGGRRGPISSNADIDRTDGSIHVLYTDASTFDLWHDEGTPFGTDTEILDGVVTFWLRGRIFTHSSANGGARVYGFIRDFGPESSLTSAGSGTGYITYHEYTIAAGTTAIQANAADGASMGDTAATVAIFTTAAADGFQAGDVASVLARFAAAAVDGIEAADAANVLRRMFGTSADGASMGDTAANVAIFAAAAADGFQAGDVASVLAQFAAAAVDGIELSDTAERVALFVVSTSDGFQAGDSATGTIGAIAIVASAADGLELSDTTSVLARFAAAAVDGIELSDTAERVALFAVSTADGVELSDVASQIAIYRVSTADGFQAGDSATGTIGAIAIVASASDGFQAGDSAERIALFVVTPSDGFQAGDSADGGAVYRVTPADGLELSDAANVLRRIFGASTDGVELSDSANVTATFAGSAVDGLTMADAVTVAAIAVAAAADGIELSDTAAGSLITAGVIAAAAIDGLELSDTTSVLAQLAAAAFDGVATGDLATTAATFIASVVDGLDVGDSMAIVATYAAAAADGVELADSVSPLRRIFGTTADGVVVGDSGQVNARFDVQAADAAEFADAVAVVATFAAIAADTVELADVAVHISATGVLSVTMRGKHGTVTFNVKQPAAGLVRKDTAAGLTGHS